MAAFQAAKAAKEHLGLEKGVETLQADILLFACQKIHPAISPGRNFLRMILKKERKLLTLEAAGISTLC